MGPLAEVEQPLDVLRCAGLVAGIFGDHVVETDQLVVDVEILVERGRARLVRVDDRQHVADAQQGVLRQLGDAADDELVVGQGHALFYNRPRAMCRPTANMPKMNALRNVSADSRRRACWPSQTPTMVGAIAATLLARLVR